MCILEGRPDARRWTAQGRERPSGWRDRRGQPRGAILVRGKVRYVFFGQGAPWRSASATARIRNRSVCSSRSEKVKATRTSTAHRSGEHSEPFGGTNKVRWLEMQAGGHAAHPVRGAAARTAAAMNACRRTDGTLRIYQTSCIRKLREDRIRAFDWTKKRTAFRGTINGRAGAEHGGEGGRSRRRTAA
jgi:hypothetical protein